MLDVTRRMGWVSWSTRVWIGGMGDMLWVLVPMQRWEGISLLVSRCR